MKQKHDWIVMVEKLEAQTTHYPVYVPDAKLGKAEVHSYEVTMEMLVVENLRKIRDGFPECVCSPGKYKGLWVNKRLQVSNTQFEYRTMQPFVLSAHGDVLLSGLGLGMILPPLCKKRKVRSVTVLEIDPDVIALVAPTYAALRKVNIIEADATTWVPPNGKKFDCAFHDIWPEFGSKYLPQYKAIRNHHKKHVTGLQACWPANLSLRMQLIERSM